MKGALYVSDSGNTKIVGSKKVDATYASIKKTCPSTCSLKQDKSCYAMNSYVGMHVARLDSRARQGSPLDVARAEARAIDGAYNGKKVPAGRALRLHVAGDSRTIKGTRVINAAVARWKKRGGGDCWGYTHAHQKVARSTWSAVSILASIESINQVEEVRKMGYAPALVVPKHTTNKAYTIEGSNVKWLPCPAQTKPGGKEIGCTDCRLCFNANRLYENNMGITFEVHGAKKNSLKRHLTVLQ
jgi:hypothetical protein